MVSPGKVTHGSRNYLTDQVAHGAEEYYSGKGEAEGTWVGGALHEIGVSGRVHSDDFNAALDGRKPGGDEPLSKSYDARTLLAVDLTINAPKSVSVMFAIGSEPIRNAVQEGHDAAVLECLAYMESQCAWGREGKAGKNKVEGAGFIASAYRHRTSRAGDPHLHTHVVVNNMIHTENGRWVTLDTARIWEQCPTGSRIYHQALRRELTKRLGVEWGEGKHGLADVAGFPEDLMTMFSKRSEEIKEQANAVGHTSPRGRQIAAMITREPKGRVTCENVHEEWVSEAQTLGYDKALVDSLCQKAKVVNLTHERTNQIIDQLTTEGKLTSDRSYFGRSHVINVLTENYVPATVTTASIEAIADRFMDERAVMINATTAVSSHCVASRFKAGQALMTTPKMLAIEQAAEASVVARENTNVGLIGNAAINQGLRKYGSTLRAEQEAMVRHIISSGNGVDAVIGDAGTGKTYALNVVRQMYEDAGYQVIGASLAATAAKQLQSDAGVASSTIRSLRIKVGRNPASLFKRGKIVMIVDEAAMAGTDDTAALIAIAEKYNGKLIFIGDDKQLPAIQAGGFFTWMCERLGAARLTENMRQIHEEQRVLVGAFRDGHGQEGLLLANELGQLHVSELHDETITSVYRSWANDPRRHESLMIAGRRTEVRALNQLAQRARIESGELPGRAFLRGVYDFHIGDKIRCRARDGAGSKVANGTTGQIVGVDRKHKTVTVRTDDGQLVALSKSYVENPDKFQLGYAITAHSAQGATCWNSYVLVTNETFRELLYTAASRAKNVTNFYVTQDSLEQAEAGYEPDKVYKPLESIFRGASRSQAQASAIGVGEPDLFDGYPTHEIVSGINELREQMTDDLAGRFDAELIDGSGARSAYFDDASVRKWAGKHPEAASSYKDLHNELELRLAISARRMLAIPPRYITREIGEVPDSPLGRNNWMRATKHIERHRARYGVDDPNTAFGPPTSSVSQRRSVGTTRSRVAELNVASARAVQKLSGRSL